MDPENKEISLYIMDVDPAIAVYVCTSLLLNLTEDALGFGERLLCGWLGV
jgi:hypothetical protein